MKGRGKYVIGGLAVLLLGYLWWRHRGTQAASSPYQTLAQIPGGSVPVMSSGGGTSTNPTATSTTHPDTVTTFSSLTTTPKSAPQTTWEATNTPAGFSDEAVHAAALKYAQGRSYGGVPYVPIHTSQEGHIEERGGVKGVFIKYETPGLGASTEWTPL